MGGRISPMRPKHDGSLMLRRAPRIHDLMEKKMSTDFRALTPIKIDDLFDGRLSEFGAHEHRVAADHEFADDTDRRCLVDEAGNFLWVFYDEQGYVTSFTRWGVNCADHILAAITDACHVEIVSEHEAQYWGYATEEEWDAAWEARAEEDRRAFYNQVARFVRGEDHDIRPGTIGMIQAEIAKRLWTKSPELLDESKRSDLIKAVESIYERDLMNDRDDEFSKAFLDPVMRSEWDRKAFAWRHGRRTPARKM